MSRMPSPIDQLKVRIGYTPATARKRCAVCTHVCRTQSHPRFKSISCGMHGVLVTDYALCKDFSPREGFSPAKDPC